MEQSHAMNRNSISNNQGSASGRDSDALSNLNELQHYKKQRLVNRKIPERTMLTDDENDVVQTVQVTNTRPNMPQQKRLVDDHEFVLDNRNVKSFQVVQTKKTPQVAWVIPAIAFIILLMVGFRILSSIRDIEQPKFLMTNTTAISRVTFVETMNNNSLIVEQRDVGQNIIKTTAHTEDYSYEIDFIEFITEEQARAYFKFINEYTEEISSSYSKSMSTINSAEKTYISSKYDCLIDISYIDNTIIIGLAYETNEYEGMVNIMNELGY